MPVELIDQVEAKLGQPIHVERIMVWCGTTTNGRSWEVEYRVWRHEPQTSYGSWPRSKVATAATHDDALRLALEATP